MSRTVVLSALAILAVSIVGCTAEEPIDASSPQAVAAVTEAEATMAPGDLRADRPNVVLIVVDTLRADHLGHYGYERDTTAPIDPLRNRSTIFTNAWSTAPWTGPSTISIHTGLSTVRHGANAHGDRIPEEATTLAEYLSEAGYATFGISFNPNVSEKTGFDQGFDRFAESDRGSTTYPDISRMTTSVFEWAESAPSQPFFLYLHPMNVHGPYLVPTSRQAELLGHPPSPEFVYYDAELMHPLMHDRDADKEALRAKVTPALLQSLTDQYDVAVRYSMEQIAAMLGLLNQKGLLANTIVVLTSDHGEELFDHGGFSHGYSLHRELLHVPLYLYLPGQAGPARSDRLVSTIDILPTLLDLTGIEPHSPLDGLSLLTPDDQAPADRVVLQQTAWKKRAQGVSAVRGHRHLIDLEQSYDQREPRLSLYDLEHDPGEQHDLATTREDLVAELQSALSDHVEALARTQHLETPENVLGQMDLEQLRALGYVE